MKNLFLLLGLSAMIGCSTPSTEQPATQDALPTEFNHTENYLAPVFENDQRTAIIERSGDAIEQIFQKRAEDMHYPGQAYGVVVDNELVLTGQMGVLDIENEFPATTESYFRIASMSKSFTAMTILQLRDLGKLKLDDPVKNYIPEVGKLTYLTADAPEITVRNLLTMTAGFPEDNPWGDRQLAVSDEELIGLMAGDVAFSTTTGTGYEYSNVGYALLGNIISRVSGMPYQQYVKQAILEPLGMNHTIYEYSDVPDSLLAKGYRWEEEQWKNEPILHDGAYGAMGGMITTIKDFSKYVSYHLSAWPPSNLPENGPVKRSSVREMHQMTFPSMNENSSSLTGEDCAQVSGYGFGLRITKYCDGSWGAGHGGALPGFASYYLFYPEYGIGIMSFCNLTYTSPAPAIREVAAHLFSQSGMEKRQLPVSDILKARKEQVFALITTWDEALDEEMVAMNLYMDKSKELRKKDVQEKLVKVGTILGTSELTPFNQLRGTFEIYGEADTLSVFFTLNPEKEAKLQRLDVW